MNTRKLKTEIQLGVVLLRTRRFAEMVHFYESVLGFPKRLDLYREGIRDQPDNWATFRVREDLDIEMFAVPPSGGPIAAPAASVRLGFIVADLDAAVAQVTARGGALKRSITPDWWGREAWFLDPDGNEIQLYQPDPI